ncbi:MAG TPA: peptidoglycan DD-metalloendopeptidase family protein [Gammaproteobacteria bacterium]|nr:peptidoglycan DD-metalloendopeptidase family protein [Gammaproteobacteria bacterium]
MPLRAGQLFYRTCLSAGLACVLSCILIACGSGGLRWNSQLYRVHAGETLYAIAWRYNLDYRDLARWNGIAAPYTIHPGQELTLTDPALLPETRQAAASSNKASAVINDRRARPAAHAETRPALPPPSEWIWPTRGQVVQTFQGQQSIAQGIDIAGVAGQDVRASADGRVVYSGNGLSGFGQLIIIKHNDTYISAYGHNRNLLVAEGAEVKAGQKIAEMGKLGGNARLHFEIRRQGKPVDPLKYLPRP